MSPLRGWIEEFASTGRRLTNLGLTPPGYTMSPLRG